jgi:ribose 5-phosphate isomerase B
MRIAFGNDHRGVALRARIIEHLKSLGHEVVDFGTNSDASVDYPDFAAKVAGAVSAKKADLGILVCGTGIGMSIAANKVPGIRAAVCLDEIGAKMARAHNDANVLALRGTHQDPDLNMKLVDTFLTTPFEGGRHERRVKKIEKLETQHSALDTQDSALSTKEK